MYVHHTSRYKLDQFSCRYVLYGLLKFLEKSSKKIMMKRAGGNSNCWYRQRSETLKRREDGFLENRSVTFSSSNKSTIQFI